MSDTDNSVILEPAKLLYGDDSAEPNEEPTENAEISKSEPEEAESNEAHDDENQVNDELGEVEESEESEEVVYDFDGREVSLSDIKQWEKDSLKVKSFQADYTKKTQKLAEERRELESRTQEDINNLFAEKHSKLNDSIIELDLLIKESEEAIDWDDLREYDSAEYIKQKELKERRVKALEEAKKQQREADKAKINDPEYVNAEKALLVKNNPHWLDENGQETEGYKKDLETLSKYLVSRGITKDKQEKLVSAEDWQTMLDASRYWDSKQRASEAKEKLKKVPKKVQPTIKAKKTQQSQPKTLSQYLYG